MPALVYTADISQHTLPEDFFKRADEEMYAMKREHKVRELQTKI